MELGNSVSRRRILGGLAGAGAVTTGAVPGQADGWGQRATEYVVGIDPTSSQRTAARSLAHTQAQTVRKNISLGERREVVAGRYTDENVERLRSHPAVDYVERERYYEVPPVETRPAETDEDTTYPWGVERISAHLAHEAGNRGDDTDIVVVDTGIDPVHPALEDTLGEGSVFGDAACTEADRRYDDVTCREPWDDDDSHGTHVAGIAGATEAPMGNIVDTERIRGVAPGATLHAANVFEWTRIDGEWRLVAPSTNVADALRWAADQDYDVVNASLGNPEPQNVIEDALGYAVEDNGVVFVAAAGNTGEDCENDDCVQYPAKYDQAVCVASTRRDDQTSGFSSRGPQVDVAAPGSRIPSAVPAHFDEEPDDYILKSGTSMAAPHVAGVAALVKAHTSLETPDEIRSRIEQTTEDIGNPEIGVGTGLVNALGALEIQREPVAAATTDIQTTLVGLTVTLDGTGSSDPDGDPVTYSWTQTAGPPVTLADPTAEATTFTAPPVSEATDLTFELTVDDGTATDTESVTVTVQPEQTASGETVYVGGNDSNVYAMDGQTGEKQWAFETEAVVKSSPTVVDGTLYVGSWDDTLYALDAQTGDEVWSFEAGASIYAAPTVVDGVVYVGCDGFVYALDPADGSKRWQFAVYDGVRSSPTVVDGTLYVGCRDQRVYAIDALTGEKQWEFETGDKVDSSPTVVDGTVYVGSFDNRVYALETGTGEMEWEFETAERVVSSPAVVDGTLYVKSFDGNVYAIDADTGDQEWLFESSAFRLPIFISPPESSPSVVDGTVYIGNGGDYVYALDAQTGAVEWTTETGATIVSSPTVVGETLYIGSRDGSLYALDTQTGDEQWATATKDQVTASPTVVTDPADGHSRGSRVRQHILGHHNRFRDAESMPAADAGADRRVTEQTEVTLDGSGSSDRDGDRLAFSWTQTDGVSVELADASAETTTFTAPQVAQRTTLTFELTVDDGTTTDTDRVTITVVPEPSEAAGTTLYVGSLDNNMYAVDAESGEQRWAYRTEDNVVSSPTVVDGTVYVGGYEGSVAALDARTGDEEWTFSTGGVISSPTVVAGTVYIGDIDNTVYALDAQTGDQQWATKFEANRNIRAAPVVAADTVYVASDDGFVYALDAQTGDQQWAFETAETSRCSLVVENETVYLGGRGGRLYALDAKTGAVEWDLEVDSVVLGSPIVVEETVYAVDFGGTVYALAAQTGDQQWTASTGLGTKGSPTVDQGTLYVGDANGSVYALETETGARAWTTEIGGEVYSTPTVLDGTVYVGSDATTVHALDAGTGDEQWSRETGDLVRSSPTVVRNPDDGHSVGSRVRQQTHGHHDRYNSPPTADAGADQTVPPQATVGLTGSGSSDPDSDSLGYSWEQTGGPAVTLSDPEAVSPTFTAPQGDETTDLAFELTVTDGSATDTDTTVVTVTADGPEPIPGGAVPRDPDGDGRYEDLDADGEVSIADVQLYYQEVYQKRESEYVQNNLQYFDHNQDGTISLTDVQVLFEQHDRA